MSDLDSTNAVYMKRRYQHIYYWRRIFFFFFSPSLPLLFQEEIGLQVRTGVTIVSYTRFDKWPWEHGFVCADIECDAGESAATREKVQIFHEVPEGARNGRVLSVDD